MPIQMRAVQVALLPKSPEKERPISLTSVLWRVFSKLRRPILDDWMKDYAAHATFDAATPGRTCLDPALSRLIKAEDHKFRKVTFVTLFVDLLGFYDAVDFSRLLQQGAALAFPPLLLELSLQLYTGPRCLHGEGVSTVMLHPKRSILQGCPYAPAIAKLTTHAPLHAISAEPGVSGADLWLDDITVDISHPDPEAAKALNTMRGADDPEVTDLVMLRLYWEREDTDYLLLCEVLRQRKVQALCDRWPGTIPAPLVLHAAVVVAHASRYWRLKDLGAYNLFVSTRGQGYMVGFLDMADWTEEWPGDHRVYPGKQRSRGLLTCAGQREALRRILESLGGRSPDEAIACLRPHLSQHLSCRREPGACNWRCKACRKTATLTTVDLDLFCGQRLPLRAIAGELHLSPDDCSLLLGVDHRAIRTIFEAFNQNFVPIKGQLNDAIVVGGCSADVELDEISFRSIGRAHGIVWLRYLAVVRRGSSLVWLKRLGNRITRKGQGGGGPISVEKGYFCTLMSQFWPR
eukprot:s1011_g2.t1